MFTINRCRAPIYKEIQMYIIAYKKINPVPPSKNRKIQIATTDTFFASTNFHEINPAEYFNNAEYPFFCMDGDTSDYVPGFSMIEDHGYYILSDFALTGNNRRFYTYLTGGYPVDIVYSNEINKWILTDTGKLDGGIMQASTLAGPWEESKYTQSDISYVNPKPVELSQIETMFQGQEYPKELLIFFKDTWTKHKMIKLWINTDTDAAGYPHNVSTPYSGMRVDADYAWSTSEINLDQLTLENTIEFTYGACQAGGVVGEDLNGIINLVEE